MATGSATSTMSYEDSLSSQYLSSSMSSLSSSRRQTSWIATTYRQATNLYVTRRFHEALATIGPLLSTAGDNNDDDDEGARTGDENQAAAPIATASRSTRVKVWNFYLTLLNSIVDLGPEEGRLVFGSNKWKSLAAKVREGHVWDDVVRIGYDANEGAVDGEVVLNL